ncbi:MAG: hypothetical protein NC312_08510 [Bacteroides fragilis]|nr:hypothetical protein [Bacteroides fragilis]
MCYLFCKNHCFCIFLNWKDYDVNSIIKTVTEHRHLGNGSIILCHNGARFTAQALDTLITTLREKGYELVPISELIYRDSCHMKADGTVVVKHFWNLSKVS